MHVTISASRGRHDVARPVSRCGLRRYQIGRPSQSGALSLHLDFGRAPRYDRVASRPLLEFLRATESENLYLVGDIIDGWQLKRRWYWDQNHNNVVQTVLKKARKGTNVIFVPGNHDEAIRQFIDLDFGGIKVRDELVHVTADGKRMLVLHGDRFDGVIACAKWLA